MATTARPPTVPPAIAPALEEPEVAGVELEVADGAPLKVAVPAKV